MNHKLYYYEYSDDGGLTWNFGDYRKHLISIIDITKDNPYQVRIRNEKDEDVNWDLWSDANERLALASLPRARAATHKSMKTKSDSNNTACSSSPMTACSPLLIYPQDPDKMQNESTTDLNG